jgi:hypothetical protein
MNKRRFVMRKLLTLLTAILILTVGMSFAQLKYGRIEGVVIDTEGAALPGVSLTLESDLFPTRSAVTDETGKFVFRSLDPGTYKLTFEVPGFAKEVREQIRVIVGKTLDFRVTMKMTTIEEDVTVTAQSPIVDTKKSGTAVNVTSEWLANIPSARDPWVILEQTAGVMVDRVNVGGSQSGQQSNFYARGDSGYNVMWNLDGLTITDQGALGATPTYWDFDAFEEIQITTGGADPSIQTGGIGLNFVTKRGGNKFRGQAYFYRTDDIPVVDFQSSNVLGSELANYWRDNAGMTDEEIQAAYPGDRINRIKDYGFEAGGPIIKNKLWLWGAWGVQDIKMYTAAGTADDTLLDNINLKLNAQITPNTRAELLYFYGNKLKWGRGAAITRPADTTWDQEGPTNLYKVELEHIFSDKFFATIKFGYVDMWFTLTPKGGIDTPTTLSLDTGTWGGSYYWYKTTRPSYHLNVTGNLFLEDVLGGSHEWKFGAEWRDANVTSQSSFGGNQLKLTAEWWQPYWADYGLTPVSTNSFLVGLIQGTNIDVHFNRYSFWLGDTFTTGRLTLNLGLRYDYRFLNYNESILAAQSAAPVLLPAFTQPQENKFIKWSDLSPRIGFTYDLAGDGKTIIRGNAGIYYDQLGTWNYGIFSGAYWREVDFYWHDANEDFEVQEDELVGYPDPDWISYFSDAYNVDDPTVSPNSYDPSLSSPKTIEAIVGFERELFPDFSVSANFIWRRLDNYTWDPINDVTSADFTVEKTVDNQGNESLYDGNTYTMTYYELPYTRPSGVFVTNRPDYYQRFMGVEMTITKRLSNKWMMNAALNYSDHRQYYDSPAAYQDPTNIEFENGKIMAYESGGSGKVDIWANTRWQVKINGMYQLPLGFNVSGFLTVREGYVLPVRLEQYSKADNTESVYPYVKPFGSERLPTFWMADFRIEKVVPVGDYGSISIIADIFNLFNNNTVLGRETILNYSTAFQPLEIINPRVFRLGVRFRF